MYENKYAYKCMRKTCKQMYDKNTYKHAYKCMKKKCIQIYEKTRIQTCEKNIQTRIRDEWGLH